MCPFSSFLITVLFLSFLVCSPVLRDAVTFIGTDGENLKEEKAIHRGREQDRKRDVRVVRKCDTSSLSPFSHFACTFQSRKSRKTKFRMMTITPEQKRKLFVQSADGLAVRVCQFVSG